jgi:hypothetical protein
MNGSREENTSKQKDRTFGSDSIRTEGRWLLDHSTITHHIRGGPKGPLFFAKNDGRPGEGRDP